MSNPLKSPLTFEKGIPKEIPKSLEGIESKIFIEKGFVDLGFKIEYFYNNIVNFIFGIGKLNYKIFSTIYNITANTSSAVDDLIVNVINTSAGSFSELYKAFLPLMIIVLLLYSVYASGKHRKNLFLTFFKGAFIIFMAGAIYNPVYNGRSGVAIIYEKVNNMTSTLASEAVQGLAVSSIGGKLDIQTPEEIEYGYEKSSTVVDETLKVYFDRSIWYPYVGMNSDLDENGSSNLTDEQLLALREVRSGDEKTKLAEEDLKNIIGTEDEPIVKNLRIFSGSKFEFAILSVFDSLLTGILLASIGILSFVLKMIILIIFFVFPVILIIGVLPMFHHVLESSVISIGKNLLMTQFLNVGMVVILSFDSTVTNIFTGLIKSYLFAFFAKWFAYIVAWKTRKIWLQALRPKNHSVIGRAMNKAHSFADKEGKRSLLKVGGAVATGALLANGARRLMAERLQNARQNRLDRKDKQFKLERFRDYLGQGDSIDLAVTKSEHDTAQVKLQRQEYQKARLEKLQQRRDRVSQVGEKIKSGRDRLSDIKEKGRLHFRPSDYLAKQTERLADFEQNKAHLSKLSNRIGARSRVSHLPNELRVKRLARGTEQRSPALINRQSSQLQPVLRAKPNSLSPQTLNQVNDSLTNQQRVTFASAKHLSPESSQKISLPRREASGSLKGFDSKPYLSEEKTTIKLPTKDVKLSPPLNTPSPPSGKITPSPQSQEPKTVNPPITSQSSVGATRPVQPPGKIEPVSQRIAPLSANRSSAPQASVEKTRLVQPESPTSLSSLKPSKRL